MRTARVVRFMKIYVKMSGDIFFSIQISIHMHFVYIILLSDITFIARINFDRLKSWTKSHKMKFIKDKCKMHIYPKGQLYKEF